MFITMEDETGLMDLVLFPKAQKDCAKPALTSEILTVEGKLQRTGKNGRSISIVVEKVILPWTGLIKDLWTRCNSRPVPMSSLKTCHNPRV